MNRPSSQRSMMLSMMLSMAAKFKPRLHPAAIFGLAAALLAGLLSRPETEVALGGAPVDLLRQWGLLLALVLTQFIFLHPRRRIPAIGLLLALTIIAAVVVLRESSALVRDMGLGFWFLLLSLAALVWLSLDHLAELQDRQRSYWRPLLSVLTPLLFGLWLLALWQITVTALAVPEVLLPAPSAIAERFIAARALLWADFQQTFLKAVLIGYVVGCSCGFLTALLCDAIPFMRRGLLPLATAASALPIVGIAPIMVMWFGFDWPSKAAVVVAMTFFPMLINSLSGLAASTTMQRDLLLSLSATPRQSLFLLRLPAALPFIFTGLKICSTLALIGAIVAEFFGTPIVGMGFRISAEIGRMNVAMVWSEIAVAALAGSLFYLLLATLERATTFWHPSQRAI